MLDISPQQLRQLHKILEICAPIDSNEGFRAVFVDSRISMWRNDLPEATKITKRIDLVIDFLRGRYDDNQQNALILLLHVLADRISEGDSCKHKLLNLAQGLENKQHKKFAFSGSSPATYVDKSKKFFINLLSNKQFVILLLLVCFTFTIAIYGPSFYHWWMNKANEDESLIILIPYSGRFAELEFSPERVIRDSLQTQVEELVREGYNIRLEIWTQAVSTAQEAREIGQLYQATLVIWGEFDDVIGIRTFIEILPELPSFDIQQSGSFLTLSPYVLRQSTVVSENTLPIDALQECLGQDLAHLADYSVLLSLGIVDMAWSSPERAEDLFSQAIEVVEAPHICQWNSDQAYYWRGTARMMQDRYSDARYDFEQAVQANPDFWPAFAQLGSANLALGQPDETYFQVALKHIPPDDIANRVIIHSNLCLARMPGDTPGDTLACYRTVKEEIGDKSIPSEVQVLYLIHLGYWYHLQKNCNEAERLYDEALAFLDEDKFPRAVALVEENKGLVMLCQKEYDQADQHLAHAKILYQENDQVVSMARVQIRIGMVDYLQRKPSAPSKFNEALTLAKQASSLYYQAWANIGLGLTAEQNDNAEVACQYYQQALNLLEDLNSPEIKMVQDRMKESACEAFIP
ncbi:tetratricopeptide repeat protein [Anaerolineales bacterium HSG24]|nr:tetratricopeptide repeat protein [Anaerolineales bacterium HSG24]